MWCFCHQFRSSSYFVRRDHGHHSCCWYCLFKGFHNLWIESDSKQALKIIQDPQSIHPPEEMRHVWDKFCEQFEEMNICASHIYREGNQVADYFANIRVSCLECIWWCVPPKEVQDLLFQDITGVPRHRKVKKELPISRSTNASCEVIGEVANPPCRFSLVRTI